MQLKKPNKDKTAIRTWRKQDHSKLNFKEKVQQTPKIAILYRKLGEF